MDASPNRFYNAVATMEGFNASQEGKNATGLPAKMELNWGVLALSLLIVATTLGNVLVCLAVCWDRRLQNMTNYFLMSLAIADLLVSVLVMPLGLVVELYGFFPLDPGLCVIWASMDVLMCTASIWHMCTMSMDRYFTLKYPMKYGRNKTTLMVAIKITFVWVISIAICSPIGIMGFMDNSHVYNDNQCAPAIPSFLLYGSVFAFYVPLFIMVVTYTLTTRILWSNQKMMQSLVAAKTSNGTAVAIGNGVSASGNHNNNKLLPVPSLRNKRYKSRDLSDLSISEKASVQESEDLVLGNSAGRSPPLSVTLTRKGSNDSAAALIKAAESHSHIAETLPDVEVTKKAELLVQSAQTNNSTTLETTVYQFSEEAGSPVRTTKGFKCHDSLFLEKTLSKPTLSVSQPHLPSMMNHSMRRHLKNKNFNVSPSTSHHSLNISNQVCKSVNHLQSVQNFDSILSLNSMLSINWGSEAWSDFDDPAMLEKLSQIEAEMDKCLTLPEESQAELEAESSNHKSTKPTEFGLCSDSDENDSPKSCGIITSTDSPSLLLVDSPQVRSADAVVMSSNTSGNRGVFCYSGYTPQQSPAAESCGTTFLNEISSDKINKSANKHSSVTSSQSTQSPTSPPKDSIASSTNIPTDSVTSPAILIDDVEKNTAMSSPDSALRVLCNGVPLDNKPRCNGRPNNLQFITPTITTSPASSHSPHSQGSSEFGITPTISDHSSEFINLELKPQGCYMYRIGPQCIGSPWRPQKETNGISARTCEDSIGETESISFCGDTDPWQLMGKEGLERLSNGCPCSKSMNHLCPHVNNNSSPFKTSSNSTSNSGSNPVLNPNSMEAELVSQEVERSTDETLSDHLSCSTTSTNRYHVPSLSIHWSAKSPNQNGIPWKTFLKQYSLKRGGHIHRSAHKHQFMSKRTASNEKKASKVLGIIFGVFVILWTPFFLVNFFSAVCVPCIKVITPPMMAVMIWLGYLSSLANPIIYTMFNTSFRRAFYNILTCRLRRKRRYHHNHSSQSTNKRQRTGNTVYYNSTNLSDRKINKKK